MVSEHTLKFFEDSIHQLHNDFLDSMNGLLTALVSSNDKNLGEATRRALGKAGLLASVLPPELRPKWLKELQNALNARSQHATINHTKNLLDRCTQYLEAARTHKWDAFSGESDAIDFD